MILNETRTRDTVTFGVENPLSYKKEEIMGWRRDIANRTNTRIRSKIAICNRLSRRE